MPRVMLLCTDLHRGGLPLRLARLAPWLSRLGFQPVVGCLAPPGPLSEEFATAGIETFACDAHGRFDLTCLSRLAGHIRRLDPDVIHASLFHANLAARLVGRLDRTRPIITSTVTVEIERPTHRWLETLTIGLSDVHVANSQAVARHLIDELGFPGEKVRVISNAIDLHAVAQAAVLNRDREGIPPDAKLVVWAGRMDPIKRLDDLLYVFQKVRRRVDARLVLLGDGPERRRIEQQIRRLHLESDVRIAGWRQDVLSWFKAADAFLFTSRTEGSPNAVLEATACHCPIVATEIPAIREIVDATQWGSLAPPGDIERLAALLENTLQSGRKDQPPNSALLAHHDPAAVAQEWGRLYEEVASRFP